MIPEPPFYRKENVNYLLRLSCDLWYFNNLDQRFGDHWPGQIMARLEFGKFLYYSVEFALIPNESCSGRPADYLIKSVFTFNNRQQIDEFCPVFP
jgi:hypothetical protein